MDTDASQKVDATYDGSVLRPDSQLQLPPNTRVRLTIEPVVQKPGTPLSSFDVALSLKLEGPADWSEKFDEYLYGGRPFPE